MLHLFEGKMSSKLSGTLLHEKILFSPFIYLLNYLFTSVWINEYLFHTLGYNQYYFIYFVAQTAPVLAIHSSFTWLLCSLDMPPSSTLL